MKTAHLKRPLALLTLMLLVLQLFAQGPNNSGIYYKAANGKKGKALKTALFSIIKTHTNLGYDGLLAAYEKTDKRPDGKVWDMYSCTTNFKFSDNTGNYKKEGDMYNREHSFPKSWFGGKVSPMYADIVHVVPADGYVNNRRGHLPFGETKGETYQSNKGFSKVGTCTVPGYSGEVFEPADEYKGDFARIYFYMATCYEDRIAGWASNTAANTVLAGNSYPAYKSWVVTMLLRWAKEDPVSQKEIDRNNAIYGCQKNRNPYVDYPGLEQLVWGDKQDVAFSYDNYNGDNPDPDPTPDPDPDPDPTPVPDPTPDPDPSPDPDTESIVFEKVTDDEALHPAATYLIVFEGDGNRRPAALGALEVKRQDYVLSKEVTIADDGTITTEVNATEKPHTLTLGGTAGTYTLYDNAAKQYLGLSANNNKLYNMADDSGDETRWTITVSGSDTHIVNNKYTNREIRYNLSSPRFACYTSGNQTAVALYKAVTATGISHINATGRSAAVNVYTLAGTLVKHGTTTADALNQLPKGIYIVGGKKLVVK